MPLRAFSIFPLIIRRGISGVAPRLPRNPRVHRLLDLLREHTSEPVWKLVNYLSPVKRNKISRIDYSNIREDMKVNLSTIEEWQAVLRSPDIMIAADIMKRKGFCVWNDSDEAGIEGTGRTVPSWVLLYLASFKVRVPKHAVESLPTLVYANIHSLSPGLQGGLLILTAFHTARFDLLHPMAQAVEAFLHIQFRDTPKTVALYFNILLQSLLHNPRRSLKSAGVTLLVIHAMKSRSISLHKSTYLLLLEDRYFNVELTKFLRSEMVREGRVPTVEQFQEYLEVFSEHGAIHDPGKYRKVLQSLKHKESIPIRQDKYSSAIMSSMTDKDSAFNFLRSMYDCKTPTRTRLYHAGAERISSIHGWTSAFSVAMRNKEAVKLDKLLEIFNSAMNSTTDRKWTTSFRPSTATYTVLLTGLLHRNTPTAWRLGRQYFYDLIGSGLQTDLPALSAGMQLLIRLEEPHKAFHFLETWKAGDGSRLTMDITTINTFMAGLIRIRRPDVAFALWDRITPLYGVYHDEQTVNLVLQASRVAMRLDDNLTAKIREWRLLPTKRTAWLPPPDLPSERDDILRGIHDVLYAAQRQNVNRTPTGVKPYVSGIWAGKSTALQMKRVFLQILLSYDHSIFDIDTTPVVAEHRHSDTDMIDFIPLLRSLSSRKRAKWALPEDILTEERVRLSNGGVYPYPAIVPSDKNFREFFLLLAINPVDTGQGMTALDDDPHTVRRDLTYLSVADIPLILAWARKLMIVLSCDTIAVVLVLWREYNQGYWSGGASPYVELLEWLQEWVPSAAIEESRPLRQKWTTAIQKMRYPVGVETYY